MNLRKLGGLSALILAAAYVVGCVLNFTLLDTSSILDPVEKLSFLAGKQTLFHIWIFFIYVLFGVALVFLAQALHEQLRPAAPALARTATAFALIWAGLLIAAGNVYIAGLNNVSAAFAQNPAQAAAAWLAIDSVHQGLSNQEIGARLFLAVNTVKGHNRVIFDKLQVQNRTEVVARARQLGLL